MSDVIEKKKKLYIFMKLGKYLAGIKTDGDLIVIYLNDKYKMEIRTEDLQKILKVLKLNMNLLLKQPRKKKNKSSSRRFSVGFLF